MNLKIFTSKHDRAEIAAVLCLLRKEIHASRRYQELGSSLVVNQSNLKLSPYRTESSQILDFSFCYAKTISYYISGKIILPSQPLDEKAN